MPKINQEEYEVLKELDDKWKWIAVNGKGWLLGFTSMPDKKKGRWSNGEQQMGFFNDKVNGLDRELFRFIQSSDPEPYSIAKLIEEYENSLNKATPWTINFESEETEVKNIEELKSWFEDDKLYVGEYVKHKIDQLDEPETLSQEWIDENKEFYRRAGRGEVEHIEYIRVDKLQKLLVPKQEKVKISQYVADFIEYQKGTMSLYDVVAQAVHMNWSDDRINGFIRKYLEIFVRAWRHGYEIEEEPKYYILLPDMKTNWRYVSLRKNYDGLTTHYTDTTDDIYAFTEKEIKGFEKGDVWFEHFAKPVEEVDE